MNIMVTKWVMGIVSALFVAVIVGWGSSVNSAVDELEHSLVTTNVHLAKELTRMNTTLEYMQKELRLMREQLSKGD